MGIERYVGIIQYIDSQIRKKRTGTPKMLAKKMNTSEWSIYNYIKQMRNLGAPIIYSAIYESYVYQEECDFVIGFFNKGAVDGTQISARISGDVSQLKVL